MKKKYLAIASVITYFGLLLAIKQVESMSFGDAFWYSLVTLTTVGYGDVFPQTNIGKMIGVIFLLLSMGFLAFLISYVYGIVSGRWITELTLWVKRKENWYIFSDDSEEAKVLAENIRKNKSNSVFLFCKCQEEDWNNTKIYKRDDILDVLKSIIMNNAQRFVFFMDENDCDIGRVAQKYGEKENLKIFAKNSYGVSGVVSFSMEKCFARSYWMEYPLELRDQKIVIIGDGIYAQELLNQAVTANCYLPFYKNIYYVFGNWDKYRRIHHELDQCFAINGQEEKKESLYFMKEEWEENSDILRQADRIIFCDDNEQMNQSNVKILRKWFSYQADIYAYSSLYIHGAIAFGGLRQLYTEELVMKNVLDDHARGVHEQYRSSQKKNEIPSWESLSAFLKDSNRSASDHLQTKVRLLIGEEGKEVDEGNCRSAWEVFSAFNQQDIYPYLQNEHERWCRFHYLFNWIYGTERDNQMRVHPLLVDFEELSQEEAEKDIFAWEEIKNIANC